MRFDPEELIHDLEAVLAKHNVELWTCQCCGGANFWPPDNVNDGIEIPEAKGGRVETYSTTDKMYTREPDGGFCEVVFGEAQ